MKTYTPESLSTVELAAPFPNNERLSLDPKVSRFFDSLFDDFVATATGPDHIVQSWPQEGKAMHDEWQEEVFTRDKLLDARYEEIRLYAEFQFQKAYRKALLSGLEQGVDAFIPILPAQELEAIVSDYIAEGTAAAQQRRYMLEAHLASSTILSESESVIKARFEQLIRPVVDAARMGAVALDRLITGPTTIQNNERTDRPAPLPYDDPGPIVPGYDRSEVLSH